MSTFFYHRNSGRMFEVLALDPATNMVTLRNELATFTDHFDKERLKAQGYFPIKGETEADARAAAEAKLAAEQEEAA
jgi:hypothetical protein